MRIKVGGPERGRESGPVGDIQHAHFAWLTRRQRRALPSNVDVGSRVTVRFPSIRKRVRGRLRNWSGGSALIDFNRQLDLTRSQARRIRAASQSPSVRGGA